MPDRDTIQLSEGISILEPEADDVVRYSQEAVDWVRKFFSMLCFGQNEWAGKPFTLLPWQDDLLRKFYGVQVQDGDSWVRYRRFLYLEIPKKNGKSELAAGLGLYHLIFDFEPMPSVGIFAADRENANIIYNCAKNMVKNTVLSQPENDPLVYCRDSVREIRTKTGGIMKVYSSDAENKHGFSFSAILFDELHAQPNRRLWDVLTEGSDAARRQQAVIVLTTAGNDPDRNSIGWEVHEKCRKILAVRRGEPEQPLDEDDSRWCPIMYGISTLTNDDPEKIAELDIQDPNLWKQCNPSYGVTLRPRMFRQAARAAKDSDAAERNFRWLRLNQWIATKDVGWMPLTLYDKTQWGPSPKAEREEFIKSLDGLTCYGGLDLSTTTDLTAFVLLFPPQQGLESWVMLPHAWRPKDGVAYAEKRDHVPYSDWERAGFITLCDGDMIDFQQVEDSIVEASQRYDLAVLGVDPYMSRAMTSRLMDADINIIEIPQTMMHMSPAMKELERLIRAHEMLHVHNTAARWCFGNVRCAVDGNENMKPVKNRSIGRIDIAVAWIIAMATALNSIGGDESLSSAIDNGFSF